MSTAIQTKYGKATINKDGHYQIKTNEKGNSGKYLHRVIFEDFYNITLPSNIVIHHNDGNPQNNEIWNLIPMTNGEHTALHSKGNTYCKGIIVSEETRLKQSKVRTGRPVPHYARVNRSKATSSTGFLGIYLKKAKTAKQGFVWCYQYQIKNKKHSITSTNLKNLKEKVISKGLKWEIVDELTAISLCKKHNYDFKELC